ncbi:phospholipase/carboxylesterase [Murinocardiopsis flavida]|uniref:Phospholipase/carboxylesterase n=1 Tax=Murinocardiopsis flavida TaxID=645275 RepID=A0A2P8DHX8_9ACTN|nr:dienelactone hydrolase family protein [Murinocardiopsis flavida]PSK96808.1 phospholipase/carboxylesterase [Murinocardiopsis flavida]
MPRPQTRRFHPGTDAQSTPHVYVPGHGDGVTLLLLHGTGADEHDLLDLGAALAPGAALLSPRGAVEENGANRWFRRMGMGRFDVPDVIRRAGDLADFTGLAAREYGLDPAKIVAVGFSNGANIAAALLLLRPDLLRGAALFAPAAPLQGREPDRVDLAGASVFVGAGRADTITPYDQAALLSDQLTERGADVAFHQHPGGHELPGPVLRAATAWSAQMRAKLAAETPG